MHINNETMFQIIAVVVLVAAGIAVLSWAAMAWAFLSVGPEVLKAVAASYLKRRLQPTRVIMPRPSTEARQPYTRRRERPARPSFAAALLDRSPAAQAPAEPEWPPEESGEASLATSVAEAPPT